MNADKEASATCPLKPVGVAVDTFVATVSSADFRAPAKQPHYPVCLCMSADNSCNSDMELIWAEADVPRGNAWFSCPESQEKKNKSVYTWKKNIVRAYTQLLCSNSFQYQDFFLKKRLHYTLNNSGHYIASACIHLHLPLCKRTSRLTEINCIPLLLGKESQGKEDGEGWGEVLQIRGWGEEGSFKLSVSP